MCITNALKKLARFSERNGKNGIFYVVLLDKPEALYKYIYERVGRKYILECSCKSYELL